MFKSLLIIFVFIYSFSYSQNEVLCSVNIVSNGRELTHELSTVILKKDTFLIKKLKFYISNIQLVNKGAVVWEDPQTAYLIDLSKRNSFNLINAQKVVYDEIIFDLGIDSVTNTSGALSGALDPTKGMYWSWQSGYVNFKLEGYKNNLKMKNNLFQFHIGGYQSPFNSIQQITLKSANKKQLEVVFDLELFLSKVRVMERKNIMRPCLESVELSKLFSQVIYLND